MSDADQIVERADTLRSFRRAPESINELTKGLAEHPEHAGLWASLSRSYLQTSEYEASAHAARTALSHDPENGRALLTLVDVESLLGKHDEAVRAAETLVRLNPEWGYGYSSLAIALAKRMLKHGGTADVERILEAVDRGLELDPQDPNVFSRSTSVYMLLGDREAAEATLTAGLDLNPMHTDLLDHRASLSSSPSERATVLGGLLAQDPNHDTAALELSAMVFSRLHGLHTVLALGMFLIILALQLCAELAPAWPLLFIPAVVIAAVLGLVGRWVTAVSRFVRALPNNYVRRLLRRNWGLWVSFAFTLSAIGLLLTALGGLFVWGTDPATEQPSIFTVIALCCISALLLALGEIQLRLIQFFHERREGLYPHNRVGLIRAIYAFKRARNLVAWQVFCAVLAGALSIALGVTLSMLISNGTIDGTPTRGVGTEAIWIVIFVSLGAPVFAFALAMADMRRTGIHELDISDQPAGAALSDAAQATVNDNDAAIRSTVRTLVCLSVVPLIIGSGLLAIFFAAHSSRI